MLDLESQLFEKVCFLLACDLFDHFYTRCKSHDDDSHDVNLRRQVFFFFFFALCYF